LKHHQENFLGAALAATLLSVTAPALLAADASSTRGSEALRLTTGTRCRGM